jgi:hypothetical protein
MSDEPYMRYKLFTDGKDVASGHGTNIEETIKTLKNVLIKNRCND